MSYGGTTAASTLRNPPILLARGIGGGNQTQSTAALGTGVWFYASTAGGTETCASNWFTDAYYIGMKAGDIVLGVACTGGSANPYVGAVGAVSTDGAALSTAMLQST